ncbi:cysteine synthase [Ceratobasidium sp. AG-Ba]|nr:cysteine synthase [Ceratobasidium sp. AG-Ba]QRW03712.1 cysteine synthase [Ceratobasidium sp. AG-Ba]
MAQQLPNNIVPDALLCSVGGGGLLCGIAQGMRDVGWEQTLIITSETHGANAYHLSLLANSDSSSAQNIIPANTTLSTVTIKSSKDLEDNLIIATLPAITSEAISLGARSPARTAVELWLERRLKAIQYPANRSGLIAVSFPDEIVIRATLEFLEEQKMLVELACAATLAHAYVPGLLNKLVPINNSLHRPTVIFVVCGGAKTTLQDIERYHRMVELSGTDGFEAACQEILVESQFGVYPTVAMENKVVNDPVQSIVDPDNPMHIETPLIFAPLMSGRLGYDIYLKLENLQPSQSFKYRGISLYAARAVKEHGPGVHLVTASGGNAGLALAWAGKALGVRTTIYIPKAAHEVKPALLAAGAEVVIEGKDYAAALESARTFCSNTNHAVLFHAYDHPTLWEGHSTLVYETARQLPHGVAPDAIICSVGGAGLLGGVLRGVNDLGWDQTQVVTIETFGANCFHLSLLANDLNKTSHELIPSQVEIFQKPRISPGTQSDVRVAHLSSITSQAASLGAPSPAQAVLEQALDRRARAAQDPSRLAGLTAVTVSDEIAMRGTLGFLDEQKMLVELACAVTLSPAYIPGFLEKLVPKRSAQRPVVVFVVCGGSKILLTDVERYQSVVRNSGDQGLLADLERVMIDSNMGLAMGLSA